MSDQPSQNNESTFQSLLKAPEVTLRFLWQLMANVTELINNLLHHINTHPDFDTWLTEWAIPTSVIDSFIRTAKTQSPYREMPIASSPSPRISSSICSSLGLKPNDSI